MDAQKSIQNDSNPQGQLVEHSQIRTEVEAGIGRIHLDLPSNTTTPHSPNTANTQLPVLQDSLHPLQLGYVQVFNHPTLPNSRAIANNLSMANNTTGENDSIHAAYIYYMANQEDKNLTCQCVHCGQIKAKNTTRQRQHLLHECPVLHPSSKAAAQNETSIRPQKRSNESAFTPPDKAVIPPLSQPQRLASRSQNPSPTRVQGVARPAATRISSHTKSSPTSSLNVLNTQENTQNRVRAAIPHSSSVQLAQPALPSGANHPLSTYYQPPASQNDVRPPYSIVHQQKPSNISPQTRPWMSHHEARAPDTFPQPSKNAFIIKIEPDSGDQRIHAPSEFARTPEPSRTETPLTSIEAEKDDEESGDGQSLGESGSSTAEGSDEGSDEGSGSQLDGVAFSDEDDETFPFDDEDDETDDDDANPDDPNTTAAPRRADGQFGPDAIHKRRRVYKRGKRGPTKPEEPSLEFTALQNEAMRVFIEEQDNQKAMRLAQQAIGVNPEFYSAHALLSEIYFAEGEDQKGVNALYLGAHSAPRDPDIWQGVADACLRLTTIDRETALRQALNCFRRIIDIDENNHDALFQRASIYREMGNLNRALREYDNLLKVMPNNTSITRQKAPILQELGRVDEALRVCEDCIAHGKGLGIGAEDEFSWPDIIVYTDIFARCGQIDEAIVKLKRLSRWLVDREMEEYWDDVVDDDREWDAEHEPRRVDVEDFHPNLFEADLYGVALPLELRVKLGLYRLTQGLDSRIEAFGHFEWLTPDNLMEGAPVHTHPQLFLDAGNALKEAKEHQEALRYYEALMAVDAYSDVSFWLQVAATSYICEKKEQSRICYEAAKTADRDCVEAKIQLGMLYAELGDKENAVQNAEEAVEMTTRGIEKADRRRYEKKNQKAARKAAERVLKIARRVNRPRKKRARPPPGPAQIKRKQNALERKAKKLATKIDKQTRIYERRGAIKKILEQSEELRTSKVQQLYSHLTELTSAMREGDPEARTAWLDFAQQMIEDFCSTEALFPSERHMNFEGYDKDAIKRSQTRLYQKIEWTAPADGDEQTDGITGVRPGNPTEHRIPTEYRTIPFTAWLDIFLETALLHATSGAQWKDACYALLRTAHDCTVWYHDRAAVLQVYTCYFACALELHDEHTLFFTVGRWFMKEYQFCTDAYRLFAAMNLLYTDPNGGKPFAMQSEFRQNTTQKFMLRQLGALDSRLPEDYNEHGEEGPVPGFMRTTFATGLNNVQEDGEEEYFAENLRPKEMDVVLLSLYGHIMYAGDTFVSALNYFYRALTLDPKNPMVLLSIALCYMHEIAKRGTEDRHMHVLNGMAVFEEYVEARLEQAGAKGENAIRAAGREIEFNRARLWQMLGLSDLALKEYDKLLRVESDHLLDGEESGEEWSMETAFAAANIYAANGDPAMAKYITERWLVVE